MKSFVKNLNLSAGTVTGRSDLVEYGGSPRRKDSWSSYSPFFQLLQTY